MISSFSELIKEDYYETLSDDGKSYIDIIQDGIDRLNEVVMDLLEYTRTDRTDIKRDTCNFNKVLNNTLISLKNQINNTNAKIIYDDKKLPVIWADCSQLEQLLQNLISNAIKFVKDKSPVIKIDVADNQEEWIFSINDNGIGIKKDYHNKIFNIFQRLHSKEEFPGTGIGLAIVKKVIEKHNGRIWLESTEGKGTTVYFSIPKQ
jgi:light-regulated signal transduction histidine kinase (bacteriophytochrome)